MTNANVAAAADYASLKSFSPEFTEFFLASTVEELAQEYSDNFKEAHGIRPRWMNLEAMTHWELAQEFERLAGELKAAQEWERECAEAEAEAAAWHARWANLSEPFPYEELAIRRGYLH